MVAVASVSSERAGRRACVAGSASSCVSVFRAAGFGAASSGADASDAGLFVAFGAAFRAVAFGAAGSSAGTSTSAGKLSATYTGFAGGRTGRFATSVNPSRATD